MQQVCANWHTLTFWLLKWIFLHLWKSLCVLRDGVKEWLIAFGLLLRLLDFCILVGIDYINKGNKAFTVETCIKPINHFSLWITVPCYSLKGCMQCFGLKRAWDHSVPTLSIQLTRLIALRGVSSMFLFLSSSFTQPKFRCMICVACPGCKILLSVWEETRKLCSVSSMFLNHSLLRIFK